MCQEAEKDEWTYLICRCISTLTALVCQEDKDEAALQDYFEEQMMVEQCCMYIELSQLYKSGDNTLKKFKELKPKDL